jgi:hypothetical protein
LIGTAGGIVFFYLFGTDLYLTFKFHGGHEEIEKGYQGEINLKGKEKG